MLFLKRHRLQMSDEEVQVVEGKVKSALYEYFGQGGRFGYLDHSVERMEQRLGFRLNPRHVMGILTGGHLDEVRLVKADNGVEDFRITMRSTKLNSIFGKEFVVIYSMTYHKVVTSYYRKEGYDYEDKRVDGALDAYTMPPLFQRLGDRLDCNK